MLGVGENNLSFIETSALDASNVELAFQNILTGTASSIPTTWQDTQIHVKHGQTPSESEQTHAHTDS
jgi:hypothetical protein